MVWDPYAVLGVSPVASPEDIKRAYRQLARHCHPDRVGSQGEEQFKAITAAYEILGDPEKRRQWDAQGSEKSRGQDHKPPTPGTPIRVVVKTQSPEVGAAPAQLQQIRDLLKAQQYMAAVRTAEDLHAQFPQDAKVRHLVAVSYYRLGEAHVRCGHVDLGQQYLFKAMQTDPQDAGLLFDVKRALSRLCQA